MTLAKRLGIAAAVAAALFLILLASAVVVLERAADPERLRSAAEQELSAALGQKVAIASLRFDLLPTPRLSASGVRVGPTGSPPPLSLDRLVVYPEIRPLLSRRLVITRLDLVGVSAALRRDRSGRWILPVSPPPARAPGSGPASDVRVDRIGVSGGTLSLRDESLTSPKGEPLDLQLRGVSGQWTSPSGTGRAELKGVIAGGGEVELSFSRGRGLQIEGAVTGCPAVTLRPLLWSTVRLAPSAGTVDLSAKSAGSGFASLETTVKARLRGIVSPGFGAAAAAFAPRAVDADVEASLQQEGPVTRIASLKTTLSRTTLTGRGTVDGAGARLDIAVPSLDPRDLDTLMGLLGVAPVPGLSLEGKSSLKLLLTVPPGSAPMVAKGEARAEKVRLSTLAVKKVVASYRFTRGVLTLDPLAFEAYEGKERGTVTLDLNRTPAAYTVQTALEGMDVNKALSANTSAKDLLLGTANLTAQVQGAGFETGALQRNLKGTSDFLVTDGTVKGVPLLAKVNRALKITGGDSRDTRFDKLRGHLEIAGGVAHAAPLVLRAGEMRVVAEGDLRFDLTVDLKGMATFSEAKSKELFAMAGELRRLKNEQGLLELPLTIRGPLSSPDVSVDLSGTLKKQMERELKDQLLKQLLGD